MKQLMRNGRGLHSWTQTLRGGKSLSGINVGTVASLLLLLILVPVLSTHAASKVGNRLGTEVCAITAFFNPFRFASRVANFAAARAWSEKQGLAMLVVELAFDSDPFELSDQLRYSTQAVTKFLRRRTSRQNILWHKEALLNIALQGLESFAEFDTCTKIVWLDSDVILEDGWIEATSEMLERYKIGQPYTHVVRLPRGTFMPYAYWSEPRMERMGYGIAEGQVQWSYAKRFGKGVGGHTGFAWAARRDVLTSVGLYDRAIVGGFDALLAHAIVDPRCEARLNSQMAHHFEEYAVNARSTFGTELGYPNRTVKAATYWHGENKDRSYQDRHLILLKHTYDPSRDVRLDSTGVLVWTDQVSPNLREEVMETLRQRREDGVAVDSSERNRCEQT